MEGVRGYWRLCIQRSWNFGDLPAPGAHHQSCMRISLHPSGDVDFRLVALRVRAAMKSASRNMLVAVAAEA